MIRLSHQKFGASLTLTQLNEREELLLIGGTTDDGAAKHPKIQHAWYSVSMFKFKNLQALSLPKLKDLCKAQGLSADGSKSEIVLRLVSKRAPAPSKVDGATEVSREKTQVARGFLQELTPAAKKQKKENLEGAAVSNGPATVQLNFQQLAAVNGGQILSVTKKPKAVPMSSDFRFLRCKRCAGLYDLQKAEWNGDQALFWCPPCRFEVMDPMKAVARKTGLLYCGLVNQSPFRFSLDLPHFDQWSQEGDVFEVRMVRVDTESVIQAWPSELALQVNGSELFRVEPPKEGHKRRDVPQDITSGLRNGKNQIEVNMTDNAKLTNLAIAVVRATPRSIDELCEEASSSDETGALEQLRTFIGDDTMSGLPPNGAKADVEVQCLSSNRLPLVCPISMERMDLPVRGKLCKHLQCFGLRAYCHSNSMMRAFNNRWTCPVCAIVLRPRDLCIDAYVMRILTETSEGDAEEVLMMADGSWKNIPVDNDECSQ